MLPIIWTIPAEEDLAAIVDYIAPHNMSAAIKLAQRLKQCVLPLADFPLMYRESERIPGCREIVAHRNYIVLYRVLEDRIEIVNVVHGRRHFPLST